MIKVVPLEFVENVLTSPHFYFDFETSNLLMYICTKNTRNEIARLVMGTIFLV